MCAGLDKIDEDGMGGKESVFTLLNALISTYSKSVYSAINIYQFQHHSFENSTSTHGKFLGEFTA